MTSVFSGRLVFPDGRIEDEFLDRRCSATADVSTLIHVLYGVGWALAGLRLYTSLARAALVEPARLVFIALFYAAGALVHASLAVFLRNGASPSARERAKAATIAYTAVTVAFNVSFVLRPGELDLVSNPPWTRVAAVMAVFTFFDGLRLVAAIPTYSVCAAAFLGIGAKHFARSGRPTFAALDAAATFVLTLPLPLYMHTFTEAKDRLRFVRARGLPLDALGRFWYTLTVARLPVRGNQRPAWLGQLILPLQSLSRLVAAVRAATAGQPAVHGRQQPQPQPQLQPAAQSQPQAAIQPAIQAQQAAQPEADPQPHPEHDSQSPADTPQRRRSQRRAAEVARRRMSGQR